MSVAYLRLIDVNGNIYNFDPSFWLTGDAWRPSQNIVNRSYAHGGKNTADGFLEARSITIEGALLADSLNILETKLRALNKAIRAGGYLYVTDDTVSRYIIVSNGIVDSSYQGDYRTEKPITINFLAEYPFWEDSVSTESSHVLSGDGEFTVDNSGSDEIIFPTITIEADQGADLPSIKMINKSDGSMAFEYNDPYFMQGDIVEIDCRQGTVKRNSNSTIEYFTVARFLRLQNLINTFGYEGSACTITFSFRRVYL